MIRNNREKFCGDFAHWGYNWSHFQVATAINVCGLSINIKKFSQFCQLQGDWQNLHLSYRWNNIVPKSYLVTICLVIWNATERYFIKWQYIINIFSNVSNVSNIHVHPLMCIYTFMGQVEYELIIKLKHIYGDSLTWPYL